MKNVLRLLVFASLVTVFALPAFAQGTAPAPTPAATGPCTEAEAKAALYNKFRENFKLDAEKQKIAYESGKEYLTKYGACTDAADLQIIKYIQNWVSKYEKATLEFNCTKAINDSPATAFTACQPWVAANPENLQVYLNLVTAGVKNVQAKNKATNADAANAARKALQLIEQGKTAESWQPFTSQAEAAPGLHYYVGYFTLESAPAEAVTHLLKAAQSNSSWAKQPSTYDFLASAYIKNEFNPMAAEYKAKYEGKEATPESTALFNKINAVTHRIVDAYARAAALTPVGPARDAIRQKQLSPFYMLLHEGKEAGMNELLAGILAKPIMLPGQEPPPPAPATETTTANGTGTTTPTTTTPAAGTPPAKPAATPSPAPKPATTPTQKPPRS